jgi:hypothetical protein
MNILRCSNCQSLNYAMGHERPIAASAPCPLCPRKRPFAALPRNDAMGHVWTVPAVQEQI